MEKINIVDKYNSINQYMEKEIFRLFSIDHRLL